MIYFTVIFFLLFLYKRSLTLIHNLFLALTLFPACFYLSSLARVKIPNNIYLDFFALILLALFIVYRIARAAHDAIKSKNDIIINFIMVIFFFSLFAFIFHKSFLLPVYDPIQVPSFAKLIYNNECILDRLLPLSEDPFYYPPGYPVILSVFYSFCDPLIILIIFKYLNVITIALIPAVWAFYFPPLYNIRFLKSCFILLAFYYGFFLFDRTLIFGLAYSGKNSMFFCSLLFPVIFYNFLVENKTFVDRIIIILSLLGMILIHYSFLYMFSLLIFFHVLVNIKTVKNKVVIYFLLFSCSVLLFLPKLLAVKNNMIISDFLYGKTYSLTHAWMQLQTIAFTNNQSIFWVFTEIGFKWNYKNIFILIFFLLPALYFAASKFIAKRISIANEKSIFQAALVLFLAISGGIIVACGFIPKVGQDIDLFRWFMFNYYSALASVFFIFIFYMVLETGHKVTIRVFSIICFMIVPIIIFLFGDDYKKAYRAANHMCVSYDQMKELQTVLSELSKEGDCNLVTESSTTAWKLQMQYYRPLDYYAVISDCRILNGSFFTTPFAESRRSLYLPSIEFYDSFGNRPIYFIGKKETMGQYLHQMDGISAVELDYQVGNLGVYKLIKADESGREKPVPETPDNDSKSLISKDEASACADTIAVKYLYNGTVKSAKGFNISFVSNRHGNDTAFDFHPLPKGEAYLDLMDNYDRESLTVSLWVKPEDMGSYNKDIGQTVSTIIAGRGSDEDFALVLSIIGNKLSCGIHGPVYWKPSEISPQIIELSVWQHIAIVKNKEGFKFYYNGALVYTHSETSVVTGKSNWLVGKYGPCHRNGNNKFIGKIDDIRIFSRALSDTEVLGIYNNNDFS